MTGTETPSEYEKPLKHHLEKCDESEKMTLKGSQGNRFC
jgi:hypothetical protein